MAPIRGKSSLVSIACSWYSDATGRVTDLLSRTPKASADKNLLVFCVLSIPLSRRVFVSMKTVSDNTVTGFALS